MPLKAVGSNVMHKIKGIWKVKQHCTSHSNAVKAVQIQGMKKAKPKKK